MPTNDDIDAIPAGDVEDGTPVERPKSAREIAMEAIELSNLKKLEAETGVKLTDLDEDEDQDDQIDQQLAAVDATPAEPAPIKVKVDGIEKEVTQDELVRTYQKNAAADQRLEEATRLLREAEARAAQAPAPQQFQTPAEPPADSKAKVKEALDKLYEGDADSAADLLGDLLAKRGGDQPTPVAPVIDVDQIAAQLEEKLAINGAISKVQSDYPDILADRDLETLTAMKVNGLVATGIPRAQAIVEAADAMYKTLGRTPAGRQAPAKPAAPTSEKLLRKQQMDQIPVASSAAATPQDATAETDPSSVIRQMAARRLGQSLPVG